MSRFLVLLALVSQTALAADKPKPIFLTAKGDQVEPTQALILALNGDQVYKCTLVEAHVSKVGTSISLRGKK